jgi:small conductance mechanosensitive channel
MQAPSRHLPPRQNRSRPIRPLSAPRSAALKASLRLLRGTLVTVAVLALVPFLANRAGAVLERSDFGVPALATARGVRYRSTLHRLVVVALWVVGIVALLEGWHLGALGFIQSDAGVTLVAVMTRVLVVFAGGFLAWEVANIAIEAKLNAASPRKALGQRGRTLLQFLRNVVLVVILLMVTLIVLSEIGVDIGPLLAGAGVIGLAVGFGAQTLVKDVITGLFILMED